MNGNGGPPERRKGGVSESLAVPFGIGPLMSPPLPRYPRHALEASSKQQASAIARSRETALVS